MLIDAYITNFGKFQLLSGEIVWGITPLYTMQTTLLYSISEGEYSPVSGLYAYPRSQPVPSGTLSLSYDYATGQTRVYASVLPLYFDSGASSDAYFSVGAMVPTLSSMRFREVAQVVAHATSVDPASAGSTIYAFPTSGLLATL